MERPLLPPGGGLPEVTFDDAAIYFSEEQWHSLEDFQKKIYKELIKEIYETMLALGYRIPKPEIVSRIERGEVPCIDSGTKPKLDEPQAGGSKDAEPVIKVERESPEASSQYHPSEISSSQERGGAICPRCGMCCNNQCGMAFQWNGQGMYPGPHMDGNHRKPYVNPPPPYFNGNPISPGYGNRVDRMPHPTSPMGYNNAGMVPLSPHYPGYRNVGDPNNAFPFPERPGNPMYGGFEVNQPTQMGPPGSHMTAADHDRSRKEAYLHARDAQFQDRRNAMPPCPGCGNFCNNQCGASFQWEQRRLHHAVPGAMEQNRYAAPSNPYFNSAPNPAAFSNMRHPLRHGTPPVNVQGNPAMIQLSPQFAGYRRPGDPKSPNVVPGKLETSPGHPHHGGSAATASPHGPNQGSKYGTMLANVGGNHRKSQSMSPLAALETMPMMSVNSSPNTSTEQRSRPPAPQTVSSSDSNRGPQNVTNNKRLDIYHCTMQGGKITKSFHAATPPTGYPGQAKPTEMAGNKNSTPPLPANHAGKYARPSSASGLEAGRAATGESIGGKRPSPQQVSDSGPPAKRASPTIIIVDCDEGKPAPATPTGGNSQSVARATPPTSRSGSLPSTPVVISDSPESKKSPAQEAKQSVPPLTISNIRTSGIFTPPLSRTKKDMKNDPNAIIIIDDKDTDGEVMQTSVTKASNNEVQSSTPGTPPVRNPSAPGEPPHPQPLAPKAPSHGMQQSAPVLVNKVQVPQQSPIIVTGNTGLGNQSLPVNGNQSIMLTFPVTVGSSGIVLTAPMNIAENQMSAVNAANRVPVNQNPRFVQPNGVPINVTPGNVNAKVGPMTVTPVGGQSNRITVSVPPGQPKPITVNVSQPGNVTGTLSLSNTNLQNVNSGQLKAVPVTAAGSQSVGQPIPLFVDANSGLILTGPAVSSKDSVSSGIGNATVVTVNGGVMGGKLAFGNLAPVNVNGLGNTTFFAVDRQVGIGNNSPVAVANNPSNFNNKAALNISSPTILTLNGGLSIGPQPVGAPIANITSVNPGGTVQVAPTSTPAAVTGQKNSGIIIRKVGEAGSLSQKPPPNKEPPVLIVERLYNCSECGEKFSSLEKLITHQAVHKGQNTATDGKTTESTSKDNCDNDILPGGADDDAPRILYTTQGDDGSTVYVVTV